MCVRSQKSRSCCKIYSSAKVVKEYRAKHMKSVLFPSTFADRPSGTNTYWRYGKTDLVGRDSRRSRDDIARLCNLICLCRRNRNVATAISTPRTRLPELDSISLMTISCGWLALQCRAPMQSVSGIRALCVHLRAPTPPMASGLCGRRLSTRPRKRSATVPFILDPSTPDHYRSLINSPRSREPVSPERPFFCSFFAIFFFFLLFFLTSVGNTKSADWATRNYAVL